jgi:hypothetical protein
MATRPQSNSPDLDFEQIEILANFSDYSFDCPKLSFEEITKKLTPPVIRVLLTVEGDMSLGFLLSS